MNVIFYFTRTHACKRNKMFLPLKISDKSRGKMLAESRMFENRPYSEACVTDKMLHKCCTRFNHGQGRPKAPPATQNASQKSSGDKNKEVRGTKFKIVATRCHILRLKCTKFDFGWGSAPDPAGGLTALPQTP